MPDKDAYAPVEAEVVTLMLTRYGVLRLIGEEEAIGAACHEMAFGSGDALPDIREYQASPDPRASPTYVTRQQRRKAERAARKVRK